MALMIRKFNSRFKVDDLLWVGSMDNRIADQLRSDVENRRNILMSGGIGTGETTLLKALGKFIRSDERGFLIEDASEIHMGQDSLIRFEARRPQNGLPAVTIRYLLKATLRDRSTGSCSMKYAVAIR
jgi:pilus assembly protein CpaF